MFQISHCSAYKPVLWVDGANGVGALKMTEMMKYIKGSELVVNTHNDGSTGKLNHMVINIRYLLLRVSKFHGFSCSFEAFCISL